MAVGAAPGRLRKITSPRKRMAWFVTILAIAVAALTLQDDGMRQWLGEYELALLVAGAIVVIAACVVVIHRLSRRRRLRIAYPR